jgi:pyruvate kinase
MDRRAKIIATIGPASRDEGMLQKLLAAGMDIARLNFSHGTHGDHAQVIETLRRRSEQEGRAVGILQDLQGPKIRVGTLPVPIQLADGQLVTLYAEHTGPPKRAGAVIPIDFRQLFESVRSEDRLLLDDGRLALEVVSVEKASLLARVTVGGLLSTHKGINLPGVQFRIAGFTKKDEADLTFGIRHGVDAVAVSFVRSASDVGRVRSLLEGLVEGATLPLIIAKLERAEAVKDLDAILGMADGVMVARGDLGVELSPEQVPALQKRIIRLASQKGKLVITPTQMLESMVNNRLPTRAEASDIANAIYDGTDSVMLSAETASGTYPVEALQMMGRIVVEAESNFAEWGQEMTVGSGTEADDAASMARASRALANDDNVTAVASFTTQGKSARMISKIRPRVPILAFTPDVATYRRLAFLWGVRPRLVPYANTLEDMLRHVDAALTTTVKPGDQVVVVCGFPVGAQRPPNMAFLHTVGTR